MGALNTAVCITFGIVVAIPAALTAQVRPAPAPELDSPRKHLTEYRAELARFRQEYGGSRHMPQIPFFQFGMGNRAKYLFRNGTLLELPSGKPCRAWTPTETLIVPPDYAVLMITPSGPVRIVEDETAVWLEVGGARTALPGTEHPVHLPTFMDHSYAAILRELHHEILINIVGGKPVPNLYVYKKSWFRDGAMMAMCLKSTGNLNLVRDWILGLRDAFDHNNAGESEADNPGQLLYLISLVSNRDHPAVAAALDAFKRFETRGDQGLFIKGRSDFTEHPVYQTKWAKFGLRALGLPDPYVIPNVRDAYSSLFWMDYRQQHVPGAEATDRNLYPYLGWATDHFLGTKTSPISDRDYPLTWEIQASQADYSGLAVIDPDLTKQKTAVPHTWHAAEIFLYLLDAEHGH